MARYDKERIIGSGSFGNVWLVKSKLSRHSYVLKEIDLRPLNETDREHALNEVAILSKCKHKHIIRYKDTVIESGPVLSIVMEYAEGGDLHSAILKQNGIFFEEPQIIAWFIQICLALQYIHYKNILHRDLKSQNIFLTRNKIIKIGDFGIARILKSHEELAKTSIGTPYYLSPEICKRAPYNHKSDIWALGCILFEMAALEQAFQAADFIHLVSLILRGKRKELPTHCSTFIKDLVNNLLNLDPERRPSTGVILDYPLLQPYLSDYMSKHNTRESYLPVLISPNETSSRRGSVSGIFENLRSYKKRRSFSTSEMIPQSIASSSRMTKQENGTAWKYLRSSSRKPHNTSQKGQNISQKQVSQYRVANSKLAVSLNKKEQSLITVSCDTYSVPTSHSVRPKIKVSKPGSLALIETDYGYQSCKTNMCSPNSLRKESNGVFKFPSKMERENVDHLLHATENGKTSPTSDSGDYTIVHNNCEHLQCHRCMLDLLWNNRIRCYAEGSINTDEYWKLKEKLVFLYKEDLFEKIYYSLHRDSEENKNGPSTHLLSMMQSLNFEQVQSLPLMMQLVQLDLFLKSKQNTQDVCDIIP